ncbi:hypothetical protein IFM89_015573, partial [Coptis chinensis]
MVISMLHCISTQFLLSFYFFPFFSCYKPNWLKQNLN